MRIDLHCHSNASDGVLSPSELLLRAETMQLDVLAITDHDSIQGYLAAAAELQQLAAAEQAGARAKQPRGAAGLPLQLISGIEFSCSWQGFEIHILGWNFNPKEAAMQQLISAQTERRLQRAEAIAGRLQQHGVSAAHMPHAQQNAVRTRLHFAEALQRYGYVRDTQQAFDKYLAKGQCAYVAPQWCSIAEAVQAIHGSGGSAAIAHPLAYDLSNKWLRRLLVDFHSWGGRCIEVVSGQQSPEQRRWLTELAQTYHLMASVGSDFHFPGRWRELGRNLAMPAGLTPVWHDWPLPAATRCGSETSNSTTGVSG